MAMVEMLRTSTLRDASPLLRAPDALRRQAEEDGYLYCRGLLPRDQIMRVRRQVLELCRAHGWLDESAPMMDGVARPGMRVVEGNDPRWIAFYKAVLRLRDFHGLAMHPAVLQALTHVFGETAVTHSRNICRVMFPSSSEYTTPPHQDHLYIGGTQDTWTAWIPLGDCPEDLGGLALIPGSHRLGFLPSKPGQGAGGRQVEVPADALWASDAFTCGDVLLFHSLTIHQGKDNRTGDRLRVSVDYRYQPVSHPLRRDSMEPHMAGFGQGWEDIYAQWPADEPLRYYWKSLNLKYTDGQ